MNKEKIIKDMNIVFSGSPWYGNSVMQIVEEAVERDVNYSIEGGNSVAQILAHIIAWRKFVIQKLKNDLTFDITPELDWQKDRSYSKEEYKDLILELKDTQEQLVQLISEMEPERLEQLVPGRNYEMGFLLNGLIQHDIYHAGQMAILKPN